MGLASRSNSQLSIIDSGLLSLVQDLGRFGYQSAGITHGGAMDMDAFAWANKLLGNDVNDAQIEITYGGFKAQFNSECYFALCGADLKATLNGIQIKPWQTFQAKQDDLIEFKAPNNKFGLRAYLAVKGGFQTAKRLGSRSMVVREGLGDTAITKSDELPYQASQKPNFTATVPPQDLPAYAEDFLNKTNNKAETELTLDFHPILGSVPEELIKQLCDTLFTVSNQIDRMGYRLKTEQPLVNNLPQKLSYGTSVGMIQLPADGNPIVLMRDRQTMGGYPLLGCLTTDSINLLAQCLPDMKVKFRAIDY